jgi:hypothetical protein
MNRAGGREQVQIRNWEEAKDEDKDFSHFFIGSIATNALWLRVGTTRTL